MIEAPLIQWLVTQAGLAGLAALSIIILNRVWTDRLNSESARRIEEREDKLTLLQAYRENSATLTQTSAAIAEHTTTLRHLCSLIDDMQKCLPKRT